MATTITVDDTSPRIQYSSGWFLGGVPSENSGTTHGTQSTGATATFTFTGTSVAVYGTISPLDKSPDHPVSTYVVDDSSPVTFSPSVPLTVLYRQQFYRSPILQDEQHTLVITSSGVNSSFFWLDYIQFNIITTPVTTTTPITRSTPVTQSTSSNYNETHHSSSTSSGTSTAPSETASSLIAPGTMNNEVPIGAIIGGVVGGVLALLVIFLLIWYHRRKTPCPRPRVPIDPAPIVSHENFRRQSQSATALNPLTMTGASSTGTIATILPSSSIYSNQNAQESLSDDIGALSISGSYYPRSRVDSVTTSHVSHTYPTTGSIHSSQVGSENPFQNPPYLQNYSASPSSRTLEDTPPAYESSSRVTSGITDSKRDHSPHRTPKLSIRN